MVFGNIFSKKAFDATIFEQELEYLSEQIKDSRTQTLKLEMQLQTVRNKLIKYGAIIYFLAFSLIYINTPNWRSNTSRIRNFSYNQTPFKIAFLLLYPLFLYLTVKLVGKFFHSLQRRQRAKYVSLKKKKEAKIDQLKQETNFNSTNKILDKYGSEEEKKAKQQKQQLVDSGKKKQPGATGSAQNSAAIPPSGGAVTKGALGVINSSVPFSSSAVQQPVSNTNVPISSGARTFQDRLLDVIIGSENNESVENRFALICAQCYHHNGLAPPGCTHPMKVAYVCPYCGFYNGKSGEELTTANIQQEVEQKSEKEADKEEIEMIEEKQESGARRRNNAGEVADETEQIKSEEDNE